MTTETRAEAIARWEAKGWLSPGCAGCRVFYESPQHPWRVHEPHHEAASGCESGKRPHCTCEVCW